MNSNWQIQDMGFTVCAGRIVSVAGLTPFDIIISKKL